MQVHASIFKAYDIRGVVGQTLNEELAEHLGRAFGTEAKALGEKAVAVGRDGRLSGPGLAAALIRGLQSTGLDVVDIGAVTTPMLYYVAATRGKHGCNSGIQVTGSHNPKDYNGFKMVLKGAAVYGEQIQGLKKRIEAEDYATGKGRVGQMDVVPEYAARIARDCKLARPMKIVVDSGNGIPGASAPAILRALGCEVVDIFSKVDGDFPNHHPDPSRPENLEDLKKIVDIQLERLRARLAERRISLDLTDEAKTHLAKAGYDPVYGARPLKRAIQREIETPLSRLILKGEVKDNSNVRADVEGGSIRFSSEPVALEAVR